MTANAPGHRDGDDADVVGMWVTADGHIRQELLPDGRYDEARGDRRSAYTGRYTVTGSHLDYVDDTGFTATGELRDGVLHHEHLVLIAPTCSRRGRSRPRPAGGSGPEPRAPPAEETSTLAVPTSFPAAPPHRRYSSIAAPNRASAVGAPRRAPS